MAPFFWIIFMKTKNILLLICALFIASCAFWTGRKPAQVEDQSVDLLEKTQSIIDRVATREISADSCKADLAELITYYEDAPEALDLEKIKADGQQILNQQFQARMSLHSMLGMFSEECKRSVRTLFLKMRLVEDLVGVYSYNMPQVSSDTIKYQEQPVPLYEADKYAPYHVGKGVDPKAKFEFKNGDIIITKGISFVSSTISELATPKSLYSHIVFVHVDEKTKEVTTLESYVGQGASIFPIDVALKNENARILVLRAKDSALAAKAANYMSEKIKALAAQKKVIPYDYKLDFTDNSQLSCEELAYDSFKNASDGKFIIPEIESDITLKDEQFLKRVGVKKGAMMVPTDMETDSRFDIMLDWTDYRVMRDSWRKDAVLGSMFAWIDLYNYKVHENLTSIAAKVIWSTRYIPGLWQILSKVSGIPKDFTKDVPSLTITTIASLKTIGGEMLAAVTSADNAHFEKHGRWMTKVELMKALDDYRLTNPKKLRKVFREK